MTASARVCPDDVFPATAPELTPRITPVDEASPGGTDYVGMWYTARLRHGVDDRMLFGLYEQGATAPRWYSASHRHYDGLAALGMILKGRGVAFPDGLPKGRDKSQPGWRELWRAGRQPLTAPSARLLWRKLAPEQERAAPVMPEPLLLTEAETLAIERAAKAAGVSSTVWLLWTADRAAREVLCLPGAVLPWVYPVSLRGAARCEREGMNHCGGFMVTIADDMDARAVREQIAARTARLEHWRQWLLLNLGKLIGQPGVNLAYRLTRGKPGAFAGSYSNLGAWEVRGLDGIIASAPGSPAYPICITTAVCNGRRALAIRIHPVADPAGTEAELVLNRWLRLSLGQK
ncbi:MAG TPA: hypothetical protein VFW42_06625 [Fluviicoccus sp.]|nr:hypothetical protein [Fluviicoccus sp.]